MGSIKRRKEKELESVMSHLVENLRIIAILINPVMSHTSEEILKQLGINDQECKEYDTIYEYGKVTEDL